MSRQQFFVITMKKDYYSEPSYGISDTWSDAIAIAAEYWRSSDGVFDNNVWSMHEAYDGEVTVDCVKNKELYVCYGDNGPIVEIVRPARVMISS